MKEMIKKKNFLATAMEITLIVAVAAALGLSWNRTMLRNALSGEPVQQSEASATGVEPMPIGLVQVKEMHDGGQAVLIDARSVDSFGKEHIAGAVSVPLEEARKTPRSLQGKFPPDATIIVYCNGFSCHDSADLGKLLVQAGYRSVYVFEGGLPEWRDAGYAVAGGKS